MAVLEDAVEVATLEFQIFVLGCRLPSPVPQHPFDMLKVFACTGIIWNQFQDVLKMGNRVLKSSTFPSGNPQIIMGYGIGWLESDCLLVMRNCFIEESLFAKGIGQIVVSVDIARI